MITTLTGTSGPKNNRSIFALWSVLFVVDPLGILLELSQCCPMCCNKRIRGTSLLKKTQNHHGQEEIFGVYIVASVRKPILLAQGSVRHRWANPLKGQSDSVPLNWFNCGCKNIKNRGIRFYIWHLIRCLPLLANLEILQLLRVVGSDFTFFL